MQVHIITYSRIPYLEYNRRSSLAHSASCLTGISEKEGANKAICVCVSSVQPCRTWRGMTDAQVKCVYEIKYLKNLVANVKIRKWQRNKIKRK